MIREIQMDKRKLSVGYDERYLTKVKHKNIVRIFATCQEKSIITLWEEEIRGFTLGEWRNGKTRSSRQIKKVFKQLCKGIQYLHEKCPVQIIHGDIKPENIMITRFRQVKIIDFSASIMKDKDSQECIEQSFIYGTIPYSSPEVLSGKGDSITRDVYSLGMVLYFLLRGDEIFSEDVEKDILCEKSLKDIHLLKIAYSCIRFDPNLRYQSIRAIIKDL